MKYQLPVKTLDEYLKQAKTIMKQTQVKTSSQTIYKITGFYKETEFQETSIGKIPKDWSVAKLKEIFEIQRGFSYRKKDLSEIPTSIRFITINDMEKEGGRKRDAKPVYLKEELKINNRFLLKKGDLLIANTDMSKGFIIGAPLYVDDTFIKQGRTLVYSMDLTKLIPRRSVNTRFFFYLLSWNSIRKIMKSFAQGTNVLHINHDLVRNLNVVIPPLEEQWGIAEVLSSVDRAIEATERLIERLERLKKALMQELLTRGIGHKEYKQTEIGKIPKEWQVVKLQNIILKSIGGGTPSTKNPRYWDGDIPWMTSVGIPEDDIYITKGERFITEEGLRNSATNIIPKGNLIVATRVGLGKAGVNLIDIAINQDLVGLILDKKQIMPEFLAYYLRSPKALTYIMAAARGTTIKGISRQALFNIRIPLPLLNEQQKIVNMLITFDKWIKLEKKRKEKLERLKKGLMNILLTGRVRVKVVEQGVSTGSSSR